MKFCVCNVQLGGKKEKQPCWCDPLWEGWRQSKSCCATAVKGLLYLLRPTLTKTLLHNQLATSSFSSKNSSSYPLTVWIKSHKSTCPRAGLIMLGRSGPGGIGLGSMSRCTSLYQKTATFEQTIVATRDTPNFSLPFKLNNLPNHALKIRTTSALKLSLYNLETQART